MSNVEKLPVQPRREGRAVTLIGTDLPAPYLEEAEPSPLMHSASLWWRRLVRALQVLAVILLVGFYPAMIVASHSINDDPVILAADTPWASPETGMAVTLIGRELEGPGWAEDKPGWHPQARLTALPAWQDAVVTALSQYERLAAGKARTNDGNPDPDLSAAARLLAPEAGLDQTPRLSAAAEALARYEGRLERDLATSPAGAQDFVDELALFASWADASHDRLVSRIGTRDGWPAAEEDIQAFFEARARAHVASQLLAASMIGDPDIAMRPAVQERLDQIEANWRRAAELDPLFVSSQAGNARLMADHLAMMAFYIGQAGDATKALGSALLAEETAMNTAVEAAKQISDGADASES
ncbi:hypothetical protein [Henriciella aquimarina]|uniref:hypothetical protein n=1 Tax=Henriciella aquimarina TaxID=545261 RepID=UPI0009FFB2E7|nr:hypothetical protein [Henriciella aquimarina]